MRAPVVVIGLLLSYALAACEWKVGDEHSHRERGPSGSATATCGRPGETACSTDGKPASCETEVDRWKELLVIHRSVLLDRRARNDVAGAPWSFRSRLEELAGSTTDAPAFAAAWLDQWKTVTAVGPDLAPVTPRPLVDEVLATPWRGSSYELPLDKTPFRLIAIVNRIDLRSEADACGGNAGELRFVYTATNPMTSASLEMTVIVEIPYPATRTAKEWAEAWHELGALPFGDEYNQKLADLTSAVTKDSKPSTWLLRTNEIAFGNTTEKLPWELREFALENGRLAQQPLAATPRIELNRTPSLDSWAKENRARVLDGTYVLPSSFRAGAAPMTTAWFKWDSSQMESDLRTALSLGTCNGCHAGERNESSLRFQHLAPADAPGPYYGSQNGETRVSQWLNDPSGNEDELGRREKSMARALCSSCEADGQTGYQR